MIAVNLKGGLGNQMFQYAFGRCLSLQNKQELVLDTTFLLDRRPVEGFIFRDYDLDIFNLKVKQVNLGEVSLLRKKKYEFIFKRGLKQVKEKVFHYDPSVTNPPAPGGYYDGYWQTEKYFKPVEKTIREDFTLKHELPANSSDLHRSILDSNSVCLNFRRTDFLKSSVMGVPDDVYYDNSIKHMAEKVNDPVFFVFSDDIQWCRQNIKINFPLVFVDHEHAGKKFENYLRLMVSCKNFIIPNSSFAWWAAYLGENPSKNIIAPAKWFNDFDGDTKDLIPESWTRI